MSEHIIFQIADELGIKNESDIRSRVVSLSQADIEHILDKMDDWYTTQHQTLVQAKSKENTVFDIWVPTALEHTITRVTANLLFANSLYLSDPFYDHLCLLVAHNLSRQVTSLVEKDGKLVCRNCSEKLAGLEEETLNTKIESILVFYLRSKPLIENGQLIPYLDPSTAPWPILEAPFEDLFTKYDDEVDEFIKHWKQNELRIREANEEEHHLVNKATLPLLRETFELSNEKKLAFIGLGEVLTNQSIPAPSIDFLGHISGGILRGTINFLRKNSPSELSRSFTASTDNHLLTLPTLSGIPVQEIPEVLYRDKDALEQFKISLLSKVLTISEPYGTPKWGSQINALRIGLQRDLLELERTLLHIKQDHLKRQAGNVTLLSFSIALASLALFNQSLDTMTAIQSIVGGAGLSSSLRSIFESWIDYRKQIDEQQRRDVYFLWRLKHN